MPNRSQKLIKSFKHELDLKLQIFSKYDSLSNDILKFNVDDKTIALELVFKKSGSKILINVFFNQNNSDVNILYGHVYSSGELCHNFSVLPFDEENLKQYVDLYYKSLSQFIMSLKVINDIAKSSLPENDLTLFEKLSMSTLNILRTQDDTTLKNGDKFIAQPNFMHLTSKIRNIFLPYNPIIHSGDSFYEVIDINRDWVKLKNTNDKNSPEVEALVGDENLEKIIIGQKKEALSFSLIGLGSVGSCVLFNMSQDLEVERIFANDPDIFLPKNSYRSAFGTGFYYHMKSEIAKIMMSSLWSRRYRVDNKNISLKSFETDTYAIGYRFAGQRVISFLTQIQKHEYIIDCTGNDGVFKYLASQTSKIIFKIGLYKAGKIAVFGKYMPDHNYESFTADWENSVKKLGVSATSAYSGNETVDFPVTNLMSSQFYQFIKNEIKKNDKITKIEVINEDWIS